MWNKLFKILDQSLKMTIFEFSFQLYILYIMYHISLYYTYILYMYCTCIIYKYYTSRTLLKTQLIIKTCTQLQVMLLFYVTLPEIVSRGWQWKKRGTLSKLYHWNVIWFVLKILVHVLLFNVSPKFHPSSFT